MTKEQFIQKATKNLFNLGFYDETVSDLVAACDDEALEDMALIVDGHIMATASALIHSFTSQNPQVHEHALEIQQLTNKYNKLISDILENKPCSS